MQIKGESLLRLISILTYFSVRNGYGKGALTVLYVIGKFYGERIKQYDRMAYS